MHQIRAEEKEGRKMVEQLQGQALFKMQLGRLGRSLRKRWILTAMILPGLIWFIIFRYVPMYGILIAFQQYRIGEPILSLSGNWVGLYQFETFFSHPQCWRLIRNTLILNFYQLIFVFPVPIIFALLLNELKNKYVKMMVQTISYLPHFISMVAIVSMLTLVLSPSGGIVNNLLSTFGIEPVYFLGSIKWYRPIYILSEIWQNFGFSSIIYISALSSVSMELYEAATIDGASRVRQIFAISLPCIIPTIITMLILKLGGIMSLGYEKTLLLESEVTMEVADIISTFTYRLGLEQANYSFGAAVGLFTSMVNCITLFCANFLCRRFTETSLW